MSNIEIITSVLGWCTVINFCVLLFATILLTMARGCIINIHSKLLDINKEKLPEAYLAYLANYKIAIFMLNLSPYLALKFFVKFASI